MAGPDTEAAAEAGTTNEPQEWPSIPPNLGGYPRLSALFGCHPNVATFRRFGRLNSLNLLYLQAQLVHLELKLDRQCEADMKAEIYRRRLYSQDWNILRTSGSTEGGDGSQWETMLAIREILDKYNNALVLQDQIRRMPKPTVRDLGFLREWMEKPSMGAVYLTGPDMHVWKNPNTEDFVCLRAQKYDDFLSTWLSEKIVGRFHDSIGRHFRPSEDTDHHRNTVLYSYTGVGRTASILSISMSSVLPLLSIVVLNYIKDANAKIGAICGFTLLFSFCLGLVTNAKSAEVFAAAAAYAAVQVVFVTGNGAEGCPPV